MREGGEREGERRGHVSFWAAADFFVRRSLMAKGTLAPSSLSPFIAVALDVNAMMRTSRTPRPRAVDAMIGAGGGREKGKERKKKQFLSERREIGKWLDCRRSLSPKAFKKEASNSIELSLSRLSHSKLYRQKTKKQTMRAALRSHPPGSTIRARGVAMQRPPGLTLPSTSSDGICCRRRPFPVAASGSSYRWSPGSFARARRFLSLDIISAFTESRKTGQRRKRARSRPH